MDLDFPVRTRTYEKRLTGNQHLCFIVLMTDDFYMLSDYSNWIKVFLFRL